MGRPEKEGRCKKHPTHKNSNGVCPYCLRDKLANISVSSSSSSTNNAASSTSSTAYSSYDSDVSSSSVASPPKQYEERSKKRIFMLLQGRKQRNLLKSSLSFTLSKEVEKGKEEKRKSEKGIGKLWAKLVMGGKGKKNQSTLVHSKTVKESSSSSKWTFFS